MGYGRFIKSGDGKRPHQSLKYEMGSRGLSRFQTELSEEIGSAKGETLQAIAPVVLAKECF
jgi:hypothetical protein